MAECPRHPDAEVSASCRTCARSLCDRCRRDVRGEPYCEDCLAARLDGGAASTPPRSRHKTGAMTAPGLPHPTLAAFFGVIPGVGAAYNGQYQKALLHVLMFPMLVAMAHGEDIFGFLFPVYFAYMVVDAYKTALARVRKEPLPDYLGFGTLFGSADRPISAAFGIDTRDSTDVLAAEPPGPPLAAIVLIVLGAVLLSGNMGWIPRRPVGTFWPVVLIVIGIVQGRRRLRAHK